MDRIAGKKYLWSVKSYRVFFCLACKKKKKRKTFIENILCKLNSLDAIRDTIRAKLRKERKFFERKFRSDSTENRKNWPCIMTEDVPSRNKIVRAVEGGRIFLLFLPRGSRDFLPTLYNTSVTLFNVRNVT